MDVVDVIGKEEVLTTINLLNPPSPALNGVMFAGAYPNYLHCQSCTRDKLSLHGRAIYKDEQTQTNNCLHSHSHGDNLEFQIGFACVMMVKILLQWLKYC